MKTSNLRRTRFDYSHRVNNEKAQTTRQLKHLRVFGLATALLVLAGAERAIAGSYSLDFLIDPYHPGVVDSWFFDINNQGQATGYISQRVGGVVQRDAVIYRDGNSQVLPSGRTGLSINNLGEVIGTNVDREPFFFGTSGPATPIAVPGGVVFSGAFGSQSGGLNDSGNSLISFFLDDPLARPPGGFSGLALWNRQGATTLTMLDPLYPYVDPPDPNDFLSGPSSSSYSSSGTRINHANQFAAGIHLSDYDPVDPADENDDIYGDRYVNAYIYNGNGAFRILQNPTLGAEIRPINIDEMGTVFGWVGDRLALWGLDGVLQFFLPDPTEPLVPADGLFGGYPSAQRNDLGQIVAVSLDRGLLFYDPVLNSWTDITSSIDGWVPGTRFTTVQGFNEQGQFVGLARPPQGGGDFGYVVSPIPEPGALSLLLAGALGLLRTRRPAALPFS